MPEASVSPAAPPSGEPAEFEQLIHAVYDELRRRAGVYMARHGPAQTLQPTALVHEALLKVRATPPADWRSTEHFYHAVAEVMRQILVDRARARKSLKRGGGFRRVPLDQVDVAAEEEVDWTALDAALEALRRRDERRYRVVMLRYFAALTDAEIAAQLGVSDKTVRRDWQAARMFIAAEMESPRCRLAP